VRSRSVSFWVFERILSIFTIHVCFADLSIMLSKNFKKLSKFCDNMSNLARNALIY
jgi:hypothetical protein